MGARRGKGPDIEQQVQRFFHPQWMVMGKGVGLAPLPAGRVAAEGFTQMLEAVLPGDAHDRGTVGALVGAAGIPPR
ncbi:hypothetical protein D3C80_1703300 [compost metagenome]